MKLPTSPPIQILLVEDEKDILDLMLLHLKREGYLVKTAENGEQAWQLLSESKSGEKYDLLVLDWMLPGVSGLDICKFVSGKIPTLMVTARAETADIVLGLEMGADDFITKPFDIPVFLARVRALIRRSTREESTNNSGLQIGKLKIDLESHRVRCEDQEILLTPSEFKLLTALAQNQDRVLSREKLIELVQGQGVVVVDRAIDTHIFGLRKKLGSCANIIETIRGVGYRVGVPFTE